VEKSESANYLRCTRQKPSVDKSIIASKSKAKTAQCHTIHLTPWLPCLSDRRIFHAAVKPLACTLDGCKSKSLISGRVWILVKLCRGKKDNKAPRLLQAASVVWMLRKQMGGSWEGSRKRKSVCRCRLTLPFGSRMPSLPSAPFALCLLGNWKIKKRTHIERESLQHASTIPLILRKKEEHF